MLESSNRKELITLSQFTRFSILKIHLTSWLCLKIHWLSKHRHYLHIIRLTVTDSQRHEDIVFGITSRILHKNFTVKVLLTHIFALKATRPKLFYPNIIFSKLSLEQVIKLFKFCSENHDADNTLLLIYDLSQKQRSHIDNCHARHNRSKPDQIY